MKRFLIRSVVIMTGLGAAGLWMTRPQTVPNDFLASARHDAERGRLVFAAMGCASCHMAPGSEDQAVLSGGRAFPSDFGTFYAPNISSDRQMGIGAWSDREIATAVLKGTAPDNSHYYPAFPYASYEQVAASDVADLIAHLRSLPADQTPSRAHDVGFPFNIRATLGGWKWFFTGRGWVIEEDLTPEQERGRMLVEAMGHCGECHTPRNILGGMDRTAWLAGAPIPGEEGRTPDLRPENLEWSQGDIVAYLKTGLTPDYDSAGGEMVDVIANTSQLPDADLEAIAAYLLIVPGVD